MQSCVTIRPKWNCHSIAKDEDGSGWRRCDGDGHNDRGDLLELHQHQTEGGGGDDADVHCTVHIRDVHLPYSQI